MDKTGGKSNGSQLRGSSKESSDEKPSLKKGSTTSLKLPSFHKNQNTKPPKAKVGCKATSNRGKSKGVTSNNVSLVSIKNRRSVGFNQAAVLKEDQTEPRTDVEKRKNYRAALLPRNLKSRTGNSYCLVDNRRSFGPDYHPDVPSKTKKTSSKSKKGFGSKPSLVPNQAKENIESPTSKIPRVIKPSVRSQTALKPSSPNVNSQGNANRNTKSNGFPSKLPRVGLTSIPVSSADLKGNEDESDSESSPEDRVCKTKTLTRSEDDSFIPPVHDTSTIRKSHSDRRKICSDLRKLNESCVRDQGPIRRFVPPLGGGIMGRHCRDKLEGRVGLPTDRPRPKPVKCNDTNTNQAIDRHGCAVVGRDKVTNGETKDIGGCADPFPVNRTEEFQSGYDNSDVTNTNISEGLDLHIPVCVTGDIARPSAQVGGSHVVYARSKAHHKFEGFGAGGVSQGQCEGISTRSNVSTMEDDKRVPLPDDGVPRFSKQATHTLSRKFAWFKDGSVGPPDICHDIRDNNANADNNNGNISFTNTSRSSRPSAKQARYRKPTVSAKRDSGVRSGTKTHHTSRSPRGGLPTRKVPADESHGLDGSDPHLSTNGDKSPTLHEIRATPGKVGGNFKDKRLPGFKKPLHSGSDRSTSTGVVAVDTGKDILTVSHNPPGEIHSHSRPADLQSEETLSQNVDQQSISSQLYNRVDWTDVDFSPYYYNSECDSPPRPEHIEKKLEGNYSNGQAGSSSCSTTDVDSEDSYKTSPDITNLGELHHSVTPDVSCVSAGKSTSVNHLSNQATKRRQSLDVSVNTNKFCTTERLLSAAEQVSEPAEFVSPSSANPPRYTCAVTCGHPPPPGQSERSGPATGCGPEKDGRHRLSTGPDSGKHDPDSDVSTANLVCTGHRRLNTWNGYDGLTYLNDVKEPNLDKNKHSAAGVQQLSTPSDITAGSLQLVPDTGRPDCSVGQSSLRPSRRRKRRSEQSRPSDNATGIGDKSKAHVSGENTELCTDHSLRGNNGKYVALNSVSTTTSTERCFECGECLYIQSDQDQVSFSFFSHIEQGLTTGSDSPPDISYASGIPVSDENSGRGLSDTGKPLAKMTDSKVRLATARQAGEKGKSGGGSVSEGPSAKNRSPAARASPRSAGQAHNHARASNAEAPVTCKCRERAAEIKLSKLKNVNGCRSNCSMRPNERPGSRSRSQSATCSTSRRGKKLTSTVEGEKQTDSITMDARATRKLPSRASTSIKEITSPRSSKLTQTSERADIGVQDRNMSKQSAVKPTDGQGRLKISRPRSGGHKPDSGGGGSKEGCSTDRSDVSRSSSSTLNSLSPRERSVEPSKDTVKTKVAGARRDKTNPAPSKLTGKVTPRGDGQLVKPSSRTTSTTAVKKVSPRNSTTLTQGASALKLPLDSQKSLPRYCSGSTVSSRNKNVRIGKTNSPRESGAETNSKRDQSVSDTAVSVKSYSSRKSIPGTANCKINSAKPSKITNKSKCSKISSVAAKRTSEDAEVEFDRLDLSAESPTADEIQASNSNCDCESDAAIKTRDKLAVIERVRDRGAGEEGVHVGTRGGNSASSSVYLEDVDDSKDGEDKADSVSGRGPINTPLDSDSDCLSNAPGTDLSAPGPNCEARYRSPVTRGRPACKSLEQKRQPKVTARTKVVGSNASRQSFEDTTTGDVAVAGQTTDASERAVAVTSLTKCAGKRKPDAMKTRKALSDSGSLPSNRNTSKVPTSKPSALTTGAEKASSGQLASCIPKPSKGFTPRGTASGTVGATRTTSTGEVPGLEDSEINTPESEPASKEEIAPALSSQLPQSSQTQGSDQLNDNIVPTPEIDLDLDRSRPHTEISEADGDIKHIAIPQIVETTGAIPKTHCEVGLESTSNLNECNSELTEGGGEFEAVKMPPERDNKVTFAHKSLYKHRATDGSNSEHHTATEQMWLKNGTRKQWEEAKHQSVMGDGDCPKDKASVSVDTHLLTESSAVVPVWSTCGRGQDQSTPLGKFRAEVKERLIDDRGSKEKVLQNNATEFQGKHSCTGNTEHSEKITPTGSRLNITVASGKNEEAAIEKSEKASKFTAHTDFPSPGKLHSVSVSCLNWNPKNSCVEEKPRIPSEVAEVSGPKLERSTICFLPSLRTKLIPSTVKLDNLFGVLKISTPEVPVAGAQVANVQMPQDSDCENRSGNDKPDEVKTEPGDPQSGSSRKLSDPKVSHIQYRIETPICLKTKDQTNSETDGSHITECETAMKTIQINPPSSNLKCAPAVPKKTKGVRKIPVFSGNVPLESGFKPKNSPNVVIQCTGNCSVEVEITKTKSKSARRVQAKRLAYDVDYSGKKKQVEDENLLKEKSKSISDLRQQSNTVVVDVGKAKSRPAPKVKAGSTLSVSRNAKELSKSSPDIACSVDGLKPVDPCVNPMKGKNFRKSLVYSGLVKKIAVLNTPMKNRCKSNPDIAKELELLQTKEEDSLEPSSYQSRVPTKSPRPKTGTVRKVKAKKAPVDTPKYQSLSKQKSKSTPDLRDLLGGHKSPIPMGNKLQSDAICGHLVKNNYNKVNIMKFSANFYSDRSATQSETEMSENSEDCKKESTCERLVDSTTSTDFVLKKKFVESKFNVKPSVYNDVDTKQSSKQYLEVQNQLRTEFTEEKSTMKDSNSARKGKSQIPCAKTSQFKILMCSKSFNHLRNESPRVQSQPNTRPVNVDAVEQPSPVSLGYSMSPLQTDGLSDGVSHAAGVREQTDDLSDGLSHTEVVRGQTDGLSDGVTPTAGVREQQGRDSDAASEGSHFSHVTFDPICSSTGKFEPFDVDKVRQVKNENDPVLRGNLKEGLGSRSECKEESEVCDLYTEYLDILMPGSNKFQPPEDRDTVGNHTVGQTFNQEKNGKKVGPKVAPKSKKKVEDSNSMPVTKVEQCSQGIQCDTLGLCLPVQYSGDNEYKDVNHPDHLPESKPDWRLSDSSVGVEMGDLEDEKDKLFNAEEESHGGSEVGVCHTHDSGGHPGQNCHQDNNNALVALSHPPLPARVSGRYTEAQLRKIRSEGKSLLEKRSRVPKGLVEDTVNILASHLEGLLQGTGLHGNAQEQEPNHSKGGNAGESKVNFLKKRFEADQSSQELRKQRAMERSKVKKKKVARPLSVQITDFSEGQQKLDVGTGRHSVIMSTSTESSVSRDSGFPADPDCMSMEFMRPSEWRERPVSLTDSDLTSGSELPYTDFFMFENQEEDEALMSPNPDYLSPAVDTLSKQVEDTPVVESYSSLNDNSLEPSSLRTEPLTYTLCMDNNNTFPGLGDVNLNPLESDMGNHKVVTSTEPGSPQFPCEKTGDDSVSQEISSTSELDSISQCTDLSCSDIRDLQPLQNPQGCAHPREILVYHVQSAESMDSNSNFVDFEATKADVLPDKSEDVVTLGESHPPITDSDRDNNQNVNIIQECEVKMRPKTKQKPKSKFNRISSTISIFEGRKVNDNGTMDRCSMTLDVNSNPNVWQQQLKSGDSELKETLVDKRKGIIVLEGDTLRDVEKSLEQPGSQKHKFAKDVEKGPKEQVRTEIHCQEPTLAIDNAQDRNDTHINVGSQIAQENTSLQQGCLKMSEGKYQGIQCSDEFIHSSDPNQSSDDGKANLKLQNIGHSPSDKSIIKYQCEPKLEGAVNAEHVMSVSNKSPDCAADSNIDGKVTQETIQQRKENVQNGPSSMPDCLDPQSDDQPLSSERRQGSDSSLLINEIVNGQLHQAEQERIEHGYPKSEAVKFVKPEVCQASKEQRESPARNITVQVVETQLKPRRYKSPARESHSFSTPTRYQTREARAQTREARTQQREARSHSRESPRRSVSQGSSGTPSPGRQSRAHSRSSSSPSRDQSPSATRRSRSPHTQSHSLQTVHKEAQRQSRPKSEMHTSPDWAASHKVDKGEQLKPQPYCRKSHSFSEILSHSKIDQEFEFTDQSDIAVAQCHSRSTPYKSKEPPKVAKKPKHQLKRSQSPLRKSPPDTHYSPEKESSCISETVRSESPSREVRANWAPQPTLTKSQSMLDKTPTPSVPWVTVERQYQSSRLPRSCEREPKPASVTPSLGGKEAENQKVKFAKRMKSPVRDIFPNKLSVSIMDSTKMTMSPERREAELLYEKALAELSFDQGEEDDNDTTLIATNENSSLPFYTPTGGRFTPGSNSPRSRVHRSASLPTAEFRQGNAAGSPLSGNSPRSPRIILHVEEEDDENWGGAEMGHTPFATPQWSPDSSSARTRQKKRANSHDDVFHTPTRPSSYQNAMATTLLTPGEDPWSPFTGPIHHIVLPRQQSMVDIPFHCPEEYIDDDEETKKYHTIGRCQNTLMAECPRLQRNPSFYAAQKKGAIPLAVSASSHVSSPILEEHSNYNEDDVFTSSGSSDRSFEKSKEAKSPGIIKRMLRRHRSFNDRDKDRKELAHTSGSKDQSFFKFPALKSILRRGSKDLMKLAEIQKDSDTCSAASDPSDTNEQAPLAKFQRDSDIDSVPGSPYASSRRLRRSLTAGELTGFRVEKRASLVEQLPVKYNTFMGSDDDNDNDDTVSIQSLNASPIHSPTPCPPLPSRQKPYSRSSSFSVHFTDQSHTEEYSDSDNKLPSSGECVPADPLRNHFLHRDVTSSNSNDSGIQNDSSAHSSSESLKGQQTCAVVRRDATRRHQERPKSDCSVRWAHTLDTSTEEDGVDSRPLRRPRTERTNSDLGDLTTLTKAVQQFNQLTKMPHSISMKSIRRKKFIDGDFGGKSRRMSTPHPIKNRQEKARPNTNKRATLHRSLSMPVNLDKLRRRKRITSFFGFDESGNYCSPDHFSDDSSDESENSMEISLKDKCHSTRASHIALSSIIEKPYEECLTYAEALWDHVTMDPEELGFRAGDVIEVTDTADKDWWWGAVDDREGWFPAAFVRLRANQGQLEEEEELAQPMESMETAFPSPEPSRRLASTSSVSREQARTNVINEILQAEKDYVKHLGDVIEGYIHQARRHPAMFSENRIRILFGNLEEIYDVSKQFVTDLEKSYNPSLPHLTEVGQCFLNSKKEFEIYSDYCNNHPDACKELQELYRNKRYRHFFEACRLLQEMIQIPLEGFLLTPVQKICKYPLQLSELLKFTDPDHSDYNNVCQALDAMKRIACLINERKRKMESIAKISAWQHTVEDWEGSDLLELSSELITSGEAHKINRSGRSQERTLFLFDHQLIYCKKDLLRRNGFCYKGRVSLDDCELIVLPDGKDLQYNVNVKNGWKLHDRSQDKWFLFFSKSPADRERWLRAFTQERRQVQEDQENEFTIPRQLQTAVLKSRAQLEKPKGKPVARRMSTAGYYQKDVMRHLPATLPRNFGQFHIKKKGWFNFMGKKTKT